MACLLLVLRTANTRQVDLSRTATTNEMLEVFAARLFSLRSINLASCHQVRVHVVFIPWSLLGTLKAQSRSLSRLFFRPNEQQSARNKCV